MKYLKPLRIVFAGAVVLVSIFNGAILPAVAKGKAGIAALVSMGTDGKLTYDASELGDRVPDFSHCGYWGGDRAIPNPPVRAVVAVQSGDATGRIQSAIDYVSNLPVDTNGFRGCVLLKSGRHEVVGGLNIRVSGVVLAGEDETMLIATGTDRRSLIRIAGKNDLKVQTEAGWEISDERVAVGTDSFHVVETSSLKPGSLIRIVRPCTKEWIEKLGMTEMGGGIGDWRLVWKPGSRDIVWDRTVKSVSSNLITIDAPITAAIEKALGGGKVETYSWPGRIENVGVQNLILESATNGFNPKDEEHAWMAVTMENVNNAWVRRVSARQFAGSMVALYESCKGVTVEDCLSFNPVSEDGGYRRHTFFTMGQQCLFIRCWSERGRHDFGVGHCAAGPNAFVQCESSFSTGDSGGLESWACGTLFDNVRIDGNGLTLGNRGSEAQGAGWAAANSVLWQCSAAFIRCENPPGAVNWSFACWGEFAGNGTWRKSNEFIRPQSLFAAQISERLGETFAPRMMPRTSADSDTTADQIEKLSQESARPAPTLKEFIIANSKRNPLKMDVSNAMDVDKLPPILLAKPASAKRLSLSNGWLVCDGRLLVGQSLPLRWWQGNVRPSEATKFGERLSRFVPGRIGEGYTDDLNEIADKMQEAGQVLVDHHYGLWYDRRREDHERIRRMDGQVWPPFYEMPFARSGQGAAWDGLSRYDLTKYNPWYWGRLKAFADICEARGLVLFNENYFQHNILEAGAHWVDSPWRTANNINGTGFPEPPPFAGDKRIFMAPLFYDTASPVRRELHRAYIRQCLENFRGQANVIQFTSGEFSGPLPFMQFWLDTVGEWKRESGLKPLIALAAPKDVQDAILTDTKRVDEVDVICFRYWWRTDKGNYEPKGGQNLAPRQSLRQWKGGMPGDRHLAEMAAEYRARFPGKAVIAQSEDNDLHLAGWQFLCAGGSLPNIPQTTDEGLLKSVVEMKPVPILDQDRGWCLGAKGKGYLVYLKKPGEIELDLSGDTSEFVVRRIEETSGRGTAETARITGGNKIKLMADKKSTAVIWLTKWNGK